MLHKENISRSVAIYIIVSFYMYFIVRINLTASMDGFSFYYNTTISPSIFCLISLKEEMAIFLLLNFDQTS